jgi:hypothetical protein
MSGSSGGMSTAIMRLTHSVFFDFTAALVK